MKFLPIEDITYKTHLSADEVARRLSENLEPPKYRFRLLSDDSAKTYEGKIEGKTFKINRIINYRNSFLPQISGIMTDEPDGTAIKVKMTIHPAVLVFISIFVGFCGLGWIFALPASIFKGEFSVELMFGIVFSLFPYALAVIGFKIESVITKKSLKELFDAKIISE